VLKKCYDKALAINPKDVNILNGKRIALAALNQITSSQVSSDQTTAAP
jgi:hypothetical protein